MEIGNIKDISMETLFRMLNASYDGLTYTDQTGKIRYFNKAYTRMTGITEEEMLDRNVYDQAKKGYPISQMVLQVFKRKETISRVIRYLPNSDNEVLVTIVPLFGEDGGFQGIVGNIRDLTGLIDLRRSLNHIELDFNRKLEKKELENQRLREQIAHITDSFEEYNIVGRSRQMRNLTELAFRISNVNSPVLITGESGVGKDVFCKLVNRFAGNKSSYTKISCGAIPEALLESELFGYEPGAFTGASKHGKPGIFEIAEKGIVFLDEVGEMPPQLQVKLLTVLQDRKFYRIGGVKEKEFTARVIAATNKDLKEEMKKGNFRRDLYYRLNVIPVHIPPLRERREDILPLTIHILNNVNQRHGTEKRMSRAVQDILESYAWPGNIRELNNVIEHMCVLSEGDVLEPECLPDDLRGTASSFTGAAPDAPMLRGAVDRFEAAFIGDHLDPNKTLKEIATTLGVDISTLVRKMNRYNLPKRYKREK